MAIQNRNTLKGWFVTLAKPLQDQFWDWIDSYRHKNDPITINDLDDPLKEAIQNIAAVNVFRPEKITLNADGSFLMVAEYRLCNICFVNNTGNDMNITIGNTVGGAEFETIVVKANDKMDWDYGETFLADTTVYIGGVTGELVLYVDRK